MDNIIEAAEWICELGDMAVEDYWWSQFLMWHFGRLAEAILNGTGATPGMEG